MGILNIQPATRAGAHLLIQLFGASQSGKTYSALHLARGIVGESGRIGGLCTESGRMRLYADKAPGGFLIGELTAPFTPERYRQAIGEFVKAGVDILVIDSFSHVWEGTGGVLDMADAATTASGKPLQGLAKWLEPKKQYRKLLQLLMQSSIHIIFCSRAKQPMLERLGANGKPELYPGPQKPVQDKNLRYEMTIVLPMIEEGSYDTRPRDELGAALFKCPSDLRGYFDGSPPTVELGRKIAEWVGGSKTVDGELEQLLMAGQSAAAEGSEAYKAWAKSLKNLPPAHRAELGKRRENWESQAADADAEKARLAELAVSNPDDSQPPIEEERAWRTEALEIMRRAESLKPGTPEAEVYARSRGVEEFLSAYAAFVASGNQDHEKSLHIVQSAVAALSAVSQAQGAVS